jgi:SAM-dependent methyltransferase
MHYFKDQKKTLEDYRRLLKEGGTFVYGDLSPNEADNQEFFEMLERTISRAHRRYYKASETKMLLETHGFHVARMKTIAYKKSYDALIEDKGKYFDISPEALRRYVHAASKEAKEQYLLTDTELTLFYTVITATREN